MAKQSADKSIDDQTSEEIIEAGIEADETVTEENAEMAEEYDALEADETKASKAKAGKRSSKAEKEAAAEEAKEARKEAKAAAKEAAPVQVQKPRIKKYSKNMKAMRAAVDLDKLYTVEEGIASLQKISTARFDPTLELHIRLDIDPRQADQTLRASTVLPAGTGKSVTVAVLTGDEKKAAAAVAAGADQAKTEDIIASIEKGNFTFDVLVATPDMMVQLGRHAKTLGPKGLMPSPKSGTVTADPANAVAEIKKGRLEVKNDSTGIVHVAVGKLSFKAADLAANAKAVLTCIQQNRPSGAKGTFVKTISMAATMTPGLKIDPAELTAK